MLATKINLTKRKLRTSWQADFIANAVKVLTTRKYGYNALITTKPPVHIPIIKVDIPNPNPDAHDKVRLFNPEGKPIGDFNTPVDWREVKKAVQEDILKHKN